MKMAGRAGFSMIEVMAVLVILSATALAANMLAPLNATRSLDSAAEARKLVAALRSARQSAITGGTPVQCFQEQGGLIVNYTLERDSGGGQICLESCRHRALLQFRSDQPMLRVLSFSQQVPPTTPSWLLLETEKQRHEVTVVSGTGMVRYAKK